MSNSTAQKRRERGNEQQHGKLSAFTLLELMVVVSIVGVLCSVAIPNFKKAYEDLSIKKTLDEIDTLINGYRAYYLIFNEMSGDGDRYEIQMEMANFVPNTYIDKSSLREGNYNLTVTPYGNSGAGYDFQNWLASTWHDYSLENDIFFAITFSNPWLTRYLNLCRQIYSTAEVKKYNSDVLISFPEIPSHQKIDNKGKNRWY